MSTQFDKLLPLLVRSGVEFILIGGVAGNIHGSARLTFDLDIVYARNSENLKRVAKLLEPHHRFAAGPRSRVGEDFVGAARELDPGIGGEQKRGQKE